MIRLATIVRTCSLSISPKAFTLIKFSSLAALAALSFLPLTFSQSSVWLEKGERIPIDLSAELLTVEGKAVALEDFDEDILMINFWATWCGPCRAEMPSMAALHRKLSGDGLRIVAVTDEDPETVRRFLEHNPYPFTILLDEEATLSNRLKIWSIPWTLVLDSRRRLVHFHQGARLWDSPDILANLGLILNE